MALDTREKRAGAIMAGIPFLVITPLADGTIDAADRQHIANVYPGILAGEPVVGEVRHGMMRMLLMIRMILTPY